jgi:hypothetical protein
MTSRDVPTLLAILACVLVATALTGWLSMKAIEYFLPNGSRAGKYPPPARTHYERRAAGDGDVAG